MDLAQVLVRQVIRAFYPTSEILVIEALVTHSCLRDDDLAYLLKMNHKDLHKLCAGLSAQRFLVVASRQEAVENKARPISRTYYYIDYRQAIDAIKWRVYRTSSEMQSSASTVTEAKDYVCPTCKAEWTQMEVLDSWGPQGFLCHRCNSLLEKAVEQVSPAHQQSARLNNQFRFMTDLLPQIDNAGVPESTFEKALATARPVVRDITHEAVASVPIETSRLNKPTAVKGLANMGPKTMHVTISDSNEDRENEEARRLKEQMLKANQLPSWITNSSVPATGLTLVGSGPVGSSSQPAIKIEIERDFRDRNEEEATNTSTKRVKLEVPDDDEDEIEFEDVM